jgi:hypothetical protein
LGPYSSWEENEVAGIEMRGFEELKRDVERFAKVVQEEALTAAEEAAANAVVKIIEAAAPRKTGDLAGSVKIVESLDRQQMTGNPRKRLLIGPTKKKGYYGFFLDKGWRHPIGPRARLMTRRGKVFLTGRLSRLASGNTHSQRGVSGYRTIAPRHWFTNLASAMESAARSAGENVFASRIQQENI